VRRQGLRAVVGGAGHPALARLADALEREGVQLRRVGGDAATRNDRGGAEAVLAAVSEHDAKERCDIVVVGRDLMATAAGAPFLAGRLWAVATDLPSEIELLAAVPPAVADVAGVARWVICPTERIRGLVDAGVRAAARRTVVLPLDPAGASSEDGDGEVSALTGAVSALLDRTFPAAPWPARSQPLRVVVAGHALHFLEAVTEWLQGLPDVELRVDHVRSFGRHDEAVSREHVRWADTVVCEWASPVAAWYSRNKRAGQRLVVRLHRAELYSTWWHGIDIDAVDQVVCVSPHYARLTRTTTGWPSHKIAVVPNYVDAGALDRPKLDCAPFVLGMMGIIPRRKRLDLALDLLERLRAEDPRFSLHVKSQFAWDLPWAWREPDEREATEQVLRRVRGNALLADGVVFDSYGPDVGAWLRKVGWVLSLSDDESFHLAPAEGMASGAVPLIRPWPGAGTIYDTRWIAGGAAADDTADDTTHDTTHDTADDPSRTVEEMVERVLAVTRADGWDELRQEARRQARASFDVPGVCERFGRLLVEDLPADDGTPLSATASVGGEDTAG
jgi:glycosyltransferase involved in cell wall biosynthesis